MDYKVFTKFKIHTLLVFTIKRKKTRAIVWKLKETIRLSNRQFLRRILMM